MMRSIRRAIRGWIKDATLFWGKFNTFYRMVFGIAIAIGMVYGMRMGVLDPAQKELKKLTDKLAKESVPDHVPSPDTDEEVQQQKLKAENIQRNVETRKKDLSQAEKTTRFQLNMSMADATTEALRIVERNKLRIVQNIDTDAPIGGALPCAAKQFELLGDFRAVHLFLREFSEAPVFWQMDGIVIEPYTDATGPRTSVAGSPILRLSFKMILYLYRDKSI